MEVPFSFFFFEIVVFEKKEKHFYEQIQKIEIELELRKNTELEIRKKYEEHCEKRKVIFSLSIYTLVRVLHD